MLAIGSPFQLSQTVTAGIVSATGRTNVGFADYEDFIQTDAAINPGNSGGALVNSRGELVGINTGIFSESGGYQGIGFAVPSNLARRIVDDLMKYGEVQRGSDRLSAGREADRSPCGRGRGADHATARSSSRMMRDSESYEAGLRPGDVIVEFNGQSVDDPSQFFRLVADAKVGSTATAQRAARRPRAWSSSCRSSRARKPRRGFGADPRGAWPAASGRRSPRFPPGFEFLEPAAEPHRRLHPLRHDVRRLVSVAGDADHGRFIRADDPAANRARWSRPASCRRQAR